MFFSPSSINESPLSLLRFKFMETSIASVSAFSLFFFAVDNDNLAVLAVVVVVGFVIICFSVGAIVVVEDDDIFMEFFLLSSPYFLGPALFFVGVVPSFRFRAFACYFYGFCSHCCCYYSRRGRCCR